MVTLKDIAQEAQVSVMTVSNVVNGRLEKVSPQKAKQIHEIIKRLNYVQNATARSLARANSNIIAVMLRSLAGENSLSSPHNAALVGGIIEGIQSLGCYAMVNLVQSREDIARNLRSWNAQGAIFLGMFDNEIEEIHALSSIPMVFIDSYSDVRQLSSVGINDYKGGRLAAEYLLEKGHRAIAFVSPPDDENGVIRHRLDGFAAALECRGVSLPQSRRIRLESDVDQRSVSKTLDMLCEKRGEITAAFVTSDQMAALLISGLYARGIRVPRDLSIVGFDNMPISKQITPQLTTIAQDLQQKAILAVEILQHRLKDKAAPAESRVLDVQLVERQSVRTMQK